MLTILLLGGRQAQAPGLLPGAGYPAQLTRRFQADGLQPVLHVVLPTTLNQAGAWLKHQPLEPYDLILLQPNFDNLTGGELRQQLSVMLGHVQPVRHRTLLITPLPQRTNKSVRNKHKTICLEVARNWGIPCFDTTSVLQTGDEFFQAESPENLSAVAHELLGSELHEAYSSLTSLDSIPHSLIVHVEVPAWRRYFNSYMTTRR